MISHSRSLSLLFFCSFLPAFFLFQVLFNQSKNRDSLSTTPSSSQVIFFLVVFPHRNTSPSLSLCLSLSDSSPFLPTGPRPSSGYKLPVTFLATAQAGNSVRLKRGTPHVVMANITTATPIRFTPKPAFTWRRGEGNEKKTGVVGIYMKTYISVKRVKS